MPTIEEEAREALDAFREAEEDLEGAFWFSGGGSDMPAAEEARLEAAERMAAVLTKLYPAPQLVCVDCSEVFPNHGHPCSTGGAP